jgi:hypothetical protein
LSLRYKKGLYNLVLRQDLNHKKLWWFMLAIIAGQEAAIKRITARTQSWAKSWKNLISNPSPWLRT